MRFSALLTIALLLSGCGVSKLRSIHYGDTAAVTRFLDEGTPVDNTYDGMSYLSYAAAHGNAEMVKLLLARGADPFKKSRNRTPLQWALELDRQENAQILRAAEAKKTAGLAVARNRPGNLDDAAYDRMRAAAGMPPETRTPVSDVDSPSRRGAPRPDDFAVVIGIEKYSRLPEAAFAENDADAMKKHLLALGYPERNIVLLTGGQATRGAISGYVEEWLPKNATERSRVVVYFSGHGSPDPKTGDAYLVPWD
ncbi:MAG: ankyrin repeat domain-containing protein, partial [Elusimicrobiota bacterium]|nr:ankyrin repeat domain-containing protein [Elusimicrobiota bacterium]